MFFKTTTLNNTEKDLGYFQCLQNETRASDKKEQFLEKRLSISKLCAKNIETPAEF